MTLYDLRLCYVAILWAHPSWLWLGGRTEQNMDRWNMESCQSQQTSACTQRALIWMWCIWNNVLWNMSLWEINSDLNKPSGSNGLSDQQTGSRWSVQHNRFICADRPQGWVAAGLLLKGHGFKWASCLWWLRIKTYTDSDHNNFMM